MERIKRITANHVLHCQSSLIDHLLSRGLLFEDTVYVDNEDILEWWLVTPWMTQELEERSQTVIYAFDCCFWGRTTSGQAIYLDNVIKEIAQR
jgi:hypothetical protein